MSVLDHRSPSVPSPRGAVDDRHRRTILLLLIAPVATYVAIRLTVALVNSSMTLVDSAAPGDAAWVGPGAAQLVAVLGAATVLLATLWSRLAPSDATVAPALDQRRWPLASFLTQLPPEYHVAHGVLPAGATDVIDLVVVGPTGVFAIDVRSYPCDLVVRGREVTVNGRVVPGVVERASNQAAALAAEVGRPVVPIVCAVGGGVRIDDLIGRSTVDGVRFVAAARLSRLLTKGDPVYDLLEVDRIDRILALR